MEIKDLNDSNTTVKKGDKLRIKDTAIHYSNSHNRLQGLELTVEEIKTPNLGDIEALVVYFDDSINTEDITIVENPYLLEYFEKV